MTFSDKVKKAMVMNHDADEATWCHLIREWYGAMDEAGLSISRCIQHMISIRQKLLSHFRPGAFTPPGSYVAGLPMTQFEGIMCNIGRQLQLHAMTKDRTYNQRAILTLDSV